MALCFHSLEPQQLQFSCRNEEMSCGFTVAMTVIKYFKKTKQKWNGCSFCASLWAKLAFWYKMAFLSDVILPLAGLGWSMDWGRKEEGSKWSLRTKSCLSVLRTLDECAFFLLVFYLRFPLWSREKVEWPAKGREEQGWAVWEGRVEVDVGAGPRVGWKASSTRWMGLPEAKLTGWEWRYIQAPYCQIPVSSLL